jgi:hypothetical protein
MRFTRNVTGIDGISRTVTVTVEPAGGKVLVTRRTEGRDGSHLSRRPARDPGRLAAGIGEDLIADGYDAA